MLNRLLVQLQAHQEKIATWWQAQTASRLLPLYASVDLRHAEHKIAVVDTNAFPAGANNLCPRDQERLAQALREYLDYHLPGAKRILILPEEHTRNPYYLENVRAFSQALISAGFETQVGTLNPELTSSSLTVRAIQGPLKLLRVRRERKWLQAEDFVPDLVILNNDFSAGLPEELVGMDLPLIPPPGLGWFRRRKHRHFQILSEVSQEFAEVAGIDPWEISAQFSWFGPVDFQEENSRKQLAEEVDRLLAHLQQEYDRRGIQEPPFVFIKHNAGTYGMAVMTARSGEEVRKASRKTRTKMKLGKGHVPVTEVLIQEGLRTKETIFGTSAEPVLYLVGETLVGGFYRFHRQRTDQENLNVQGMEFRPLCCYDLEKGETFLNHDRDPCPPAFPLYQTLGRLAILALAREMEELREVT